jgi:hypothetical protein
VERTAPLRRAATPKDIAHAALFLASDAANLMFSFVSFVPFVFKALFVPWTIELNLIEFLESKVEKSTF